MFILWAIIIGLVIGALAKLLMPGPDPGGILVTMLLGIAGALLASFLGRALSWMVGRIGADGAVVSSSLRGPSEFATACCVRGLALASRQTADTAELGRSLRWLLDRQREDGAFPSSTLLRVPTPEARDVHELPSQTQTYVDADSIFTTATVLAALTASSPAPL